MQRFSLRWNKIRFRFKNRNKNLDVTQRNGKAELHFVQLPHLISLPFFRLWQLFFCVAIAVTKFFSFLSAVLQTGLLSYLCVVVVMVGPSDAAWLLGHSFESCGDWWSV